MPERPRNDPTPGPDVGRPVADWDTVLELAWRPAWSIRSRRGSVAPFLDLLREWRRRIGDRLKQHPPR